VKWICGKYGGKLRVTLGGHMGLWARYGWSAQWQISIGRHLMIRTPRHWMILDRYGFGAYRLLERRETAVRAGD